MKNLIIITRANFLPLSIVIVCAGWAAALWRHNVFNLMHALLAMVGALLTHVAVNVFNNYFDYRSGVDARTPKTPFSGGVEILVSGQMKPRHCFLVGLAALFGAIPIGVYFLTLYFNQLAPILAYGLIAVCFYTPFLSRLPSLSEIIAGTGFGFMGLGTYITQAGIIDSSGIALFVPISILVGLLLFLNEFPDADADKIAGRKHIVILVGRKISARIYVLGLFSTYLSIAIAVAVRAAPPQILVSFAIVPIAFKAGSRALRDYDNLTALIPALGLNVMTVLSTILLVATGFTLAVFVR